MTTAEQAITKSFTPPFSCAAALARLALVLAPLAALLAAAHAL